MGHRSRVSVRRKRRGRMLVNSKLHSTKDGLGGESGRYLQGRSPMISHAIRVYASFKKPGQGSGCGRAIMAWTERLRDRQRTNEEGLMFGGIVEDWGARRRVKTGKGCIKTIWRNNVWKRL